ncbi:hypothetical protein M422DRAFT_249403 [Sphaerobolus stellatus SS14]|uniref:Unplaced genomic scaffold SPHSTscaffold_29, whole genome shotgun sequence n=1 Tax=Sphaerobolus stellatus (strain SS14) TaxID=990650 RepID=A0A0C9W4D5_SPHS4|nr:hypothetical protein M422DRAFT_249403 [Sphaerobolus stellatus SS14]
MSSTSEQGDLDMLLAAAREEMIISYQQKYISEGLLKALLETYTIENASKWIKYNKFFTFLNAALQADSPMKPKTLFHFQCSHVILQLSADAYAHVKDDKLIKGDIVARTCPTKITIYAPTDKMVRKALIIQKYREALGQAGLMGATVTKVDSAPTTAGILGTPLPEAVYAVLGNSQKKADLITKEKRKHHAAGVYDTFHKEQLKLAVEHYIQHVASICSDDGGDNIEIVVTMLPALAELIRETKNLNELANFCSPEDMAYLRKFRSISSVEELNQFHDFCKTHPEQKIQDWYANKVMHTWYLPSLVKFLTKIPHGDWEINCRDTNINEGSHPATNRATGKGLTLLDGIEGARQLDTLEAERLQL